MLDPQRLHSRSQVEEYEADRVLLSMHFPPQSGSDQLPVCTNICPSLCATSKFSEHL